MSLFARHGLILLVSLLVLGCFLEDDDEPEYAPVRPYAGLAVDTFVHDGETYLYMSDVQDGHPAANAGIDPNTDLVTGLNGQAVATPEQLYAGLEEYRPGDVVTLEIERLDGPSRDGTMPTRTAMTVEIQLIEEPLPDVPHRRVPSPDLRYEDELRLGLRLSDITRPLAEHFGLDSPEGVLIIFEPLPLSAALEEGIDAGDVLLAINGERVNRLSDVQRAIDGLDEDEPLSVLIRQGSVEQTYSLGPLGPDVPGANQFPADARRRLAEAIARGDLHPDRVELSIRQYFWRGGSSQPEMGIGAITAIAPDSITLEIYSNGEAWTAAISSDTQLSGADSPDDLRVGEYVQVMTGGGPTARLIISLADPLEATP